MTGTVAAAASVLELVYPPMRSGSVWRTASAYEGRVKVGGGCVSVDC